MKETEEKTVTKQKFGGSHSTIKKISIDIPDVHTSQVIKVQIDRLGRIIDMQPRVGDALTHFQGQQFFNSDVKDRLIAYCDWYLNLKDDSVVSIGSIKANGLTSF